MTGQITERGWYEISERDYHSDPVAGGSLSSTGARTLATRTAAHFDYERRNGRPDRRELDVGRAAHARLLGKGADIVVVVGTGKNKNQWLTNEDKATVARIRNAGKTPITIADNHMISAMVDAARAHPTAGPMLARAGRYEQVGVWRDPTTGVWCRFMADFLPDPVDSGRMVVVDYKTTADASPDAFAKSMATYGYDQQGDWYETGVNALDPRDQPAQFALIAQEKTPPYLVSVNFLDEQARARGRFRNERARELYRSCTEAGHWPGYSDDPVELRLPGWAAREFEAQQEIADQYGEAYA